MDSNLVGLLSDRQSINRIRNRSENSPILGTFVPMAYDRTKALAALAAFQKSTGLQDFPWEKASGVGEGTLRKFREGKNLSMTQSTYEKFASGASTLLKRKISASQLTDATKRLLPVVGVVSSGGEVEPFHDDPIDWVPAPPGLEDGEVLWNRGDSMLPFYHDGDLLYHRKTKDDPARLIGEVAVVELVNGKRMLKLLGRGSRKNLFDLASTNPIYQPYRDQKLIFAAEIGWVEKKAWHNKVFRKKS